ncbi:MAG: hypothetical protein KIT14_14995 [bacterium]|nr:hypothetical protein [bacterium]
MTRIDDPPGWDEAAALEELRERLVEAERVCGELRQRVAALEHERAVVRARLGSLLELLDVLRPS